MQITTFNPSIVTSHAADAVALFEELGFTQAHNKTGIDGDVASYDLKYGEDFRVDIAQLDSQSQDMTVIRMNVRDFDEAYDFLVSKGFKNASGDKVIDTGSSKAALMISPSGFGIGLAEHIRK
ncbi:MAG: hypothetical protein J6D54_08795 [Olsenella sp.]|nr:hypothetical protein [Olsenella sp.]